MDRVVTARRIGVVVTTRADHRAPGVGSVDHQIDRRARKAIGSKAGSCWRRSIRRLPRPMSGAEAAARQPRRPDSSLRGRNRTHTIPCAEPTDPGQLYIRLCNNRTTSSAKHSTMHSCESDNEQIAQIQATITKLRNDESALRRSREDRKRHRSDAGGTGGRPISAAASIYSKRQTSISKSFETSNPTRTA